MTFDASHKVKRAGGHVKAFVRHVARDADEAAGFSSAHANGNIDPDQTQFNESFVNDGAGGFRALRPVDGEPPSSELEVYLAARLTAVTGTMKKDAVAMRPLILQLDPKWFDDHNRNWRTNGLNDEARRFTAEALRWAADEFGQANVVGGSLHLDEVHPQLHVLVTPVTSDGRLSQKDFFKGPGDLKRQHKELRLRMEAAGYDVEHKVTARSKEHLGSAEYQAKAERAKRVAALLAVAANDGKNAWEDRQSAKAELAAAQREAEEIRRRARDQAAKTGYTDGERLGFDAGMRTATQTIERRVAEGLADARRRLDEELETVEIERRRVEQARFAYLGGMRFARERLAVVDDLIDEINDGTRVADVRVVAKVHATRTADRRRESALYDLRPELHPDAREGDAGPSDRTTELGA